MFFHIPLINLSSLCWRICVPSVYFPSSSSVALLPLHLLPILPPPRSATGQRWDKGRGDPEEPERLAAGARPAAGPQPYVLPATVGSQPQPAGGVDLPQRCIFLGQSPPQLISVCLFSETVPTSCERPVHSDTV